MTKSSVSGFSLAFAIHLFLSCGELSDLRYGNLPLLTFLKTAKCTFFILLSIKKDIKTTHPFVHGIRLNISSVVFLPPGSFMKDSV